MAEPHIFLPGNSKPIPVPLGRFLPPLHEGVISAWLEQSLPTGSLVLDPFGAAPQLALEAARAGYPVAVAANNPIAHFLIKMMARAPKENDMQSALADLASARKGEERLEPHILDLYMSTCPECGEKTSARAFIWARNAENPHAKMVHCEHCGHRGEHDTDDEDLTLASGFQRAGPHRARALERIVPKSDANRKHVEEAIEAYLPRAVYALFTILNRLDGLSVSDEDGDLLFAMMLSALDRGNTLWAHPGGRERPKQLKASPIFVERNIWYELENSIALWAQEAKPVQVVEWPEKPAGDGGISLFSGRLKEMAASLGEANIAGIVTALPRPNQAYWTLSALWAGWLWGRDAIGAFASVLGRRRYDWAWHSEALYSSFNRLSVQLEKDVPMFAVVAESEGGFNTASIAAANLADFRLEGLAYRRKIGQAQLQWRKGLKKSTQAKKEAEQEVKRASRELLLARGEPSHFLHLQAAGLYQSAKTRLSNGKDVEPTKVYTKLNSNVEAALTFSDAFQRYGGSKGSLESGQWWLSDDEGARSSLADRLEIAVVRYLVRNEGHSTERIDKEICRIFPGLLTPPRELLVTILKSYGQENGEGGWYLKTEEKPKARRDDLQEIRSILAELGKRLDYVIQGKSLLQWRSEEGKEIYEFHVIASSVVGELLLTPAKKSEKRIIVLPGGRSELLLTKLERDTRLLQAVSEGWEFLKFRHLRRLAENKSLTQESFDELLGLDPLTAKQTQAPLL
jgi:hypothetical protein